MADPSMAASAKDYTKSTARAAGRRLNAENLHIRLKPAPESAVGLFKQGKGKGVFALMAQGQVQGERLCKGGGGAA